MSSKTHTLLARVCVLHASEMMAAEKERFYVNVIISKHSLLAFSTSKKRVEKMNQRIAFLECNWKSGCNPLSSVYH